MIEIKTLANTKFETIYGAFVNAFSDYVEPFDLTIDELKYMFERRGCNLDLSFGAFDDEKLVGITINGVGNWNGQLTAYDSGTGIIKEYRKQGIATRMFNESLPVLKENNITQYLLEVIKSNTGAFNLYKKAGFKVVRELDYYKSTKNELQYKKIISPQGFTFSAIEKPDWARLKSFWDFNPSWQNSIDSINRKSDHFKVLGIFKESELVGYGIIEKHTGDLPQLAISKNYRRNRLGTILFRVLINYSETNDIRIINPEAGYIPFGKLVESIGFSAGDGQYEMILSI